MGFKTLKKPKSKNYKYSNINNFKEGNMKPFSNNLITASLLIGSFIFLCGVGPCETGTDIEMVPIPAGTFQTGCTPGDTECWPDESPRHSVTLSSFEIGKYEVTQGQWEEVMGSHPSDFDTCGDNCPVEQVSWNESYN